MVNAYDDIVGNSFLMGSQICEKRLLASVAYREGWFGVFKPPRNSEDIGEVLGCVNKKNRHLDFLLQFTVFSYGCKLLN